MNIKEVKCDGIDQGWVLVNMVIAFCVYRRQGIS
jgi:hypothetical protein